MDRSRRAMPVGNKITQARHVKYCQDLHKRRLQSIKPSIDNKAPRKFKHLKRNLKKEQVEEERFARIERENRILLSKMSEIMQRNTLDNKNDSIAYSKSLNREARKRELQRITAENQAILQRIQAAQPEYNHALWEEEAKQAEKYAENIREYKLHAAESAGGPGESGIRDDMMMSGGYLPAMDPGYRAQSRERLDAATSGLGDDYMPEPHDGGRLPPMH